MESVGELVQVGETRWHTERNATAGGDGVDLVHRRLQQLFERHVVFGGTPLGDLVDLGLCAVDHLGDILTVGTGVAELHDARAGFDEASKNGLLGDDLGVVAGIGRGGHGGDQGVQIGRAPDATQLARALELCGDCDGVGGFALAVQLEDRLIDGLVCRSVEVVGANLLDDVGDRVFREHHAAEDGLLGRHVLRRLPAVFLDRHVGLVGSSGIARRTVAAIIDNCHVCQPFELEP